MGTEVSQSVCKQPDAALRCGCDASRRVRGSSQLKVQPADFRHATHQEHAWRRSSITCAQKQQFGSFDDMVQNSELPVLVDFYATWCGPCQVMSQVLSVWAAESSLPMQRHLHVSVDHEQQVA